VLFGKVETDPVGSSFDSLRFGEVVEWVVSVDKSLGEAECWRKRE